MSRAKPIDAEAFRTAWMSGVSYADLGSRFGITPPTIVAHVRRLGLPTRTEGARARRAAAEAKVAETAKPDPETVAVGRDRVPVVQVERIRQLWAEGRSEQSIADELGRSLAWVDRAHKALSLPEREVVLRSGPHKGASAPVPPLPVAPAVPPSLSPTPFWTPERDALVAKTGGFWADVAAVAQALGIASSRVMARWHLIRGNGR